MAILKFKESYLSRSRHTFATSFLGGRGQVEKLKDYWDIPISNDDLCHIVQADANAEIFLY
jgi:hypothetical protein